MGCSVKSRNFLGIIYPLVSQGVGENIARPVDGFAGPSKTAMAPSVDGTLLTGRMGAPQLAGCWSRGRPGALPVCALPLSDQGGTSMNVSTSIADLIGRTPLVELTNYEQSHQQE